MDPWGVEERGKGRGSGIDGERRWGEGIGRREYIEGVMKWKKRREYRGGGEGSRDEE